MTYHPVTRRRLAVDRHQLLILLVAAVMIGSFLLLVLWPQQRRLSALGTAVARERTLVKQKVQTSRKGIYVGARIAGLRKARGFLEDRLPPEPRLAEFLEQVAECVAAEPLVSHEVQRADAESQDRVPAVPIRLRLVGPFEAVYRCLAGIEGLRRASRFRPLRLARAAGKEGVVAEATIMVYYLPSVEVDEPAGGRGRAEEHPPERDKVVAG